MATKTAAGKTPDTKELRAKAVAKLNKHIQAFETGEQHGVGHWVNVPESMKDWHFVRFNKSVPYHREVSALMLSQGYFKCEEVAAMVRCMGFESDGENRLYLCCPPEIREWRLQDRKRKIAQRFKLMKKDFGGHLSRIEGELEIDHRTR